MKETYIRKSKLTKQEIDKFLENTKDLNPQQSHYLFYRTMMNETRRELLQFIGNEIRSMDELNTQFPIGLDQLRFHLTMLEQCFYIINSTEGWKTTPLGLAFLDNAKMGIS